METLKFGGLPASVARTLSPMFSELLAGHAGSIHSVHVTGSAVLPDYDEKLSDINSLVVLQSMDLRFLNFLAPLGKRYGKRKIAAPLVMTPDYIRQSLDAFPIEFLDFKLIHATVHGEDILKDLVLDKPALRLQAEREIKSRLIGLRQGYLATLGKQDNLRSLLVRSFTGSMALFRAIITLLDKEPPLARRDVVAALRSATGVESDIFASLLGIKTGTLKVSSQELHQLFEQYHHALESLGTILDKLPS